MDGLVFPFPPEDISPEETHGVDDAWECDACHQLIYNIVDGYPAPGAPMPKFWSIKYRKVCTACYQLATAASTPYLRAAQDQEHEESRRYREQVERLNGKRDYFSGDPS